MTPPTPGPTGPEPSATSAPSSGSTTAGAATDPLPRASGRGGRRQTVARVYARRRRTGVFWYADFRPFADVGGRQEPLTPPGARDATQDYAEAVRLYAEREAYYQGRRAAQVAAQVAGQAVGAGDVPAPAAPPAPPRLGPFLRDHLEWKASRAHVRAGTLERDEDSCKVLLRVLGNVPVPDVTPERLDEYVAQREREPGVRRGTTTAARSIRAELHTLSHALRRAKMLGVVSTNAVSLMMSKPPIPADEAVFLSDGEAARLLAAAAAEDRATAEALRAVAAARAARPAGGSPGSVAAVRPPDAGPPDGVPAEAWAQAQQVPYAFACVAAHLYTGGRAAEVLGLLVGDVDFARGRVHIRHNRWRRLKREYHARAVRLWPALAEALRAHLRWLEARGPVRPDDLLFPSPATGAMLDRFGKPLDRCVARAGIAGKRVTPKALRHTFATALLQTLVPTADGGWAVRSSFDVAKQLGHRSSKLVDSTYGHAVEDPVYRRELRYGLAAPGAGDGGGLGAGIDAGHGGDACVDARADARPGTSPGSAAGAASTAPAPVPRPVWLPGPDEPRLLLNVVSPSGGPVYARPAACTIPWHRIGPFAAPGAPGEAAPPSDVPPTAEFLALCRRPADAG